MFHKDLPEEAMPQQYEDATKDPRTYIYYFRDMLRRVKAIDWKKKPYVKTMIEEGFTYTYYKKPVYRDKENDVGYIYEDYVQFRNERYMFQVNLVSVGIVFTDESDSAEYYNRPTIFVSPKVLNALNEFLIELTMLKDAVNLGIEDRVEEELAYWDKGKDKNQ